MCNNMVIGHRAHQGIPIGPPNFCGHWLHNCWTNWLHLKFYGTVLGCHFVKAWSLFRLGIHMGHPNSYRWCNSTTTWPIRSITSSMWPSWSVDFWLFAFTKQRLRQGTHKVVLLILISYIVVTWEFYYFFSGAHWWSCLSQHVTGSEGTVSSSPQVVAVSWSTGYIRGD